MLWQLLNSEMMYAMTNFDFLLSEPDFLAFASVAVSGERILQIALSAQCAHWAPLPKGEARGLRQDGDLP